MIHSASDGMLYAFQVGAGLIRTSETGLNWQVVSNGFGGDYILHLTVDPSDAQNMYAVTYSSATRGLAVIMSGDGGVTWKPLGGD